MKTCICLLLLTAVCSAQSISVSPPISPVPLIEMYRAVEMPATFEITRNEKNPLVGHLDIKRIAEREVTKVSVVIILLGSDGTKRIATHKAQFCFADDPDYVEWARSQNIRRVIILVERVETTSGVWSLDFHGKTRESYIADIVAGKRVRQLGVKFTAK